MPRTDFIPAKEDDVASFAVNFSSLITSSPTSYSLVAGDATALAALLTAYNTALAVTKVPNTRTPTSVATKNTTKAQLIADIRALAKRIQATTFVTGAQKVALGITVPDHVRTPVAPPVTKPVLTIDTQGTLGFTLRIADETTQNKRAKPPGVDGAEVYTFVAAAGATPPADLSGWSYAGRAMRSNYNLSFDSTDAGKIVFVKAAWVNPRGQSGPVSDEIVKGIAA